MCSARHPGTNEDPAIVRYAVTKAWIRKHCECSSFRGQGSHGFVSPPNCFLHILKYWHLEGQRDRGRLEQPRSLLWPTSDLDLERGWAPVSVRHLHCSMEPHCKAVARSCEEVRSSYGVEAEEVTVYADRIGLRHRPRSSQMQTMARWNVITQTTSI